MQRIHFVGQSSFFGRIWGNSVFEDSLDKNTARVFEAKFKVAQNAEHNSRQ